MFCSQPIKHIICPGDTLYRLARYYQTTVQAIQARNPEINPYNLLVGTTIIICPGEGGEMPQNQRPNQQRPMVQPGRGTLAADMRRAWMQHVYWTRMLLISLASKLPDVDVVTARLMQNPQMIADIFGRYYYAETSGMINRLLCEHL